MASSIAKINVEKLSTPQQPQPDAAANPNTAESMVEIAHRTLSHW
jgi:hypothetical protein